ncbi:sulfate transporter CysZ [Thiohalocapsa marina]|uniref:Sulfate transporter CysZ n=1 Tax=Thiohalocapsa marina TaxID=424902 RepID=A0A5M8FPA4_9GAMM|nr:sulfate transporter CysZ [Thiohalocapsa marina]KAA6186728.1 sulfate transporter CysZ [Thiohalocapsa marina]
MPSNPARGAAFMLQGIRLIGRPGLKRFVLVPLLVNILVFSAAIWWGAGRFDALMTRLQATVPGWLAWLEWLLWPVFVVALLIVVFYTFTLVANLIAAPFNGLLAEKAETLLSGHEPTQGADDLKKLMRALPRTLLDELRKLLYAVLWSVPFLILAFAVPLVGPVIWFLFTAWMLALQYSDFPMGNHGLSFRQMRAALRRRQLMSLGFGAAAAGLTLIPVVNFIVMPAAVAGATAMWVRELRPAEPSA